MNNDLQLSGQRAQPFLPPAQGGGNAVERYRRPGCGLILLFVIIAWGLEIVDFFLGGALNQLGVRPRNPFGLIGIVAMPWLHGSFSHLFSNTLTFVVLGYIILATEKQRFFYTSFMIILFSGVGTWLIGASHSVHIGASALIYGYFGYLVTRAFLERRVLWILLGILLLVFYGGLIFGVLPREDGISWEGHLMGMIAGVWMARRNFQAVQQSRLQEMR